MNRCDTRLKGTAALLLTMVLVCLPIFVSAENAEIAYPDTVRCAHPKEYSDYDAILDELCITNRRYVKMPYSMYKQKEQDSQFDIFFPAVVNGQEDNQDFIYTDYRSGIPVSVVYRTVRKSYIFERIAVVGESIIEEYAHICYPEAEILPCTTVEDCLMQVSNGKADSAMMTEEQAAVFVYAKPQYASYSMIILEEECDVAIAVKGENREKIAEWINSIVASGTAQQQLIDGSVSSYMNTQKQTKNLNITLIMAVFIGVSMLIVFYYFYKQAKASKKEQNAVINCLSSDFECVTLIDLKSNHESRYLVSELFSKCIPGWAETDDFDKRMRMFSDMLVISEDKKRFLQECSKERITARLKDADSYTVNYKINIGGTVQYFQTKFVRDASYKNSVIAGFHSVDAEVRKELELQSRIRENAMVQKLSLQIVTTLVKIIDAKDKYTNGHSVRVATYAREIAKRAGMNEKRQQEIYYMGLLHDIGKIGVPDEVINKTGRLTDEEFAIVKQHPTLGAQILEGITEMPKLRVGALHHHERFDGRGYPDGLVGTQISMESRILGVADAYDAMSSPRSFRDAFSQEKIKEEFRSGIGTQFDPDYAKIMLDMIEEDTQFRMREQYGIDE